MTFQGLEKRLNKKKRDYIILPKLRNICEWMKDLKNLIK